MATNPVKFVNEVRSEVSKVVWPSRREVIITSIMVFTLALICAVFFFSVDVLIGTGLRAVLGYFG